VLHSLRSVVYECSNWFSSSSSLSVNGVVQELYLYMGLLVINAIINSAPLKVLARIARVGAIWQILGWFLYSFMCVRNMIFVDLFFCLHTLCLAATTPHVTLNHVAYAVVILQT